MLDERTLWAVLALVPALLALVSALIGFRFGGEGGALRAWAWALAAVALASLSLALGYVDGGLALARNALWILMMVLTVVAVRRAVGLPDRRVVALGAGVAVLAVAALLGGKGGEAPVRLSVLLAFHLVCLLLALRAVIGQWTAPRPRGTAALLAGLLLAALVQSLRLVLLVLEGEVAIRFMRGGSSEVAVLVTMGILASCLLITLGLLLTTADRLRRGIEALVWRDPLTSLLNRRGFEQRTDGLFSLARRHAQPIALAVVDIDHFKQINTRHGHAGGDRVLARLGRVLSRRAPVPAVVARFGGEEFVALLPDADGQAALRWAEHLRAEVEGASEGGIAATVSIGLALSPDGQAGFAVLFRAADQALYRAKAGGRNRVCVAAGG